MASMYKLLIEKNSSRQDYSATSLFGCETKMSTLISHIEKLSGWLAVHGVKRKDKVIVCLPNIPNALVIFYAVNKLGAIVNFINPDSSSQYVLQQLKEYDAKYVFVLDSWFNENYQDFQLINTNFVICSVADYLSGYQKFKQDTVASFKYRNMLRNKNFIKYFSLIDNGLRIEGDSASNLVSAIFNNGAIGSCVKAISHTNNAFNYAVDNLNSFFGEINSNENCILMAMPIWHNIGLTLCMHFALCNGIKVVMMPEFSAVNAIKLMKQNKVSVFVGYPYMFTEIFKKHSANKAFKTLKFALCGGGYLNSNVLAECNKSLKDAGADCEVTICYWLGEMAGISAINNLHTTASVGKCSKGVNAVVVNKDNNICAPCEVGELCLSGSTLMQGYAKSNVPMQKNMVKLVDGSSFIKTGDSGYIDELGNIFIVNRIKRVIKYKHLNIFPEEIENVVTKLKEVKCCCVVNNIDEPLIDGKIKIVVCLKNNATSKDVSEKLNNAVKGVMHNINAKFEVVYAYSLPLTKDGNYDFSAMQEVYNI